MKRLLACVLLLVFACPLQAEVVTITEPSVSEVQRFVYNRKMRVGAIAVVEPSQKFAIVLIKLHATVDQPDDYPALAVQIKAIAGVTGLTLLIDGVTPVTIPEDTQLRLVVEGQIRIDDLPEEEPPE